MIDDVRIAVGGQTSYEEGPSVLLTIYEGDQAMIEIQIPFDAARRHAEIVLERAQSWESKD